MLMERQFVHSQLPSATIDERSRQDFVQTFKLHLATRVVPEIQNIYEKQVEPKFKRQHGRSPSNHLEVASVMKDNYYYQTWGSLYRTAQEMLWTSVAEPVLRQSDDLARKATVENPKGTLELNDELEVPRYLTAVDIHCMPGSYHTERFKGDVSAGALFDRGLHLYGMGGFGPRTDMMGRVMCNYLSKAHPEFKPMRILDLGCSVGHSLLPYAETFPGADLHGIDVAAPMVRYGHARAESLGVPVHFKQMNAEETDYPDNHFDLIVSHILLHETSNKAIRRIMKECHRLVKPGGIVAHLDMCFYESMSPFNGFMMMFDGTHNNEPFWDTLRSMNPTTLLTEAGFDEDKLIMQQISRAYSGQTVFSQGKSDGGRGTWQVIGGHK